MEHSDTPADLNSFGHRENPSNKILRAHEEILTGSTKIRFALWPMLYRSKT